jgi:hypothetical protein
LGIDRDYPFTIAAVNAFGTAHEKLEKYSILAPIEI